jgi:DnaA-homolog protein
MRQLALGVRLRADATFASFVAGDNAELLTALQAQDTAPLWLWGATGTGKTHLLQATCAAAGERAAYLPLQPGGGLPPEALAGYEQVPLLCLDHVDAVAGEARWEEALFRLFNAALEQGGRLVFAARLAPRAAVWQLPDWGSRAAACVVYQVRELDDAGRMQALMLRAAQRGLQLPEETADYLLKRLPRDLPTLLGVLDQLDEASLVAQRRLTVPFIRDALERRAGTKS